MTPPLPLKSVGQGSLTLLETSCECVIVIVMVISGRFMLHAKSLCRVARAATTS